MAAIAYAGLHVIDFDAKWSFTAGGEWAYALLVVAIVAGVLELLRGLLRSLPARDHAGGPDAAAARVAAGRSWGFTSAYFALFALYLFSLRRWSHFQTGDCSIATILSSLSTGWSAIGGLLVLRVVHRLWVKSAGRRIESAYFIPVLILMSVAMVLITLMSLFPDDCHA